MANFNRLILIGNLTRDPELSYTPSNTPVCKFGIAVNRKWFSKQENAQREETMFIDCTAWAKGGELINQYCRKGNPLMIEGRLDLDTWTSPEGQKRSRHTVTVENFQFLNSGGGGGGGGAQGASGGYRDSGRAPESERAPLQAPVQASAPPASRAPDDVPF